MIGSSWFSQKQSSDYQDFSILGTDIHSHILPGMDDGSRSMAQSLEMVQGMVDLGFKKLILTPHVMEGYTDYAPSTILQARDKLQSALDSEGIQIVIEAGAEYMISDDFEEKIKEGEMLTFNGKHILIELSTFSPHPKLKNMLFDLSYKGYTVIVAHIERYTYWFDNLEIFRELQAGGSLLQVNILSLGGYYNPLYKKNAELLAEENLIDILGSDLHHPISIPLYKESLKRKSVQDLMTSGILKNSLF